MEEPVKRGRGRPRKSPASTPKKTVYNPQGEKKISPKRKREDVTDQEKLPKRQLLAWTKKKKSPTWRNNLSESLINVNTKRDKSGYYETDEWMAYVEIIQNFRTSGEIDRGKLPNNEPTFMIRKARANVLNHCFTCSMEGDAIHGSK